MDCRELGILENRQAGRAIQQIAASAGSSGDLGSSPACATGLGESPNPLSAAVFLFVKGDSNLLCAMG